VRRLALLAAVALLAGCGGGAHGKAQLWVTRDQGRHVLLVKTVPAGLTALQALDRETQITTRYGGRFVQSIDGVAGSLAKRQDWIWYVNGIEGDRGAAEYRLHAGDVEWWDYRNWSGGKLHVPVVVGAFPEPFLHGLGGKVPPAVVIGSGPGARAIAKLVHGRVAASAPAGANVFRIVPGAPHFVARPRAGGGYEFEFAGDAQRLARDPASVRYRYAVP
jgi:uncharacterized protein DUF4430